MIRPDYDKLRQEGIEVPYGAIGKRKAHCPKCHEQRRNKRDKSLYLDLNSCWATCFHCDYRLYFGIDDDWRSRYESRYRKVEREKSIQPVIAKTMNFKALAKDILASMADSNGKNIEAATSTQTSAGEAKPSTNPLGEKVCLSEKVIGYLKIRGISEQTARSMGVFSTMQRMPQTGSQERVIAFPYFVDGELVNVKYRSAHKYFKLITGAPLVPFNIDAVKHSSTVIITEGEFDALAMRQAGLEYVISVPNGATTNTSFLDPFMESHFANKSDIVIAVDNDAAGRKQCSELVSRLGSHRCRVVDFGKGCKDANELLVAHGEEALRRAVAEAKEVPIEGIYTAEDQRDKLYDLRLNGLQRGMTLGLGELDNYISFERGRLVIMSCIPGDGKSEWLDVITMLLNLRYNMKVGYFSPENYPSHLHQAKIIEKLVGKRLGGYGGMSLQELDAAIKYISANFFDIMPEENFTIDSILDIAQRLVDRLGIGMMCLDPFNSLEHKMPSGMNQSQYIDEFLEKLRNFARRNNVLVFLVAHPTKLKKDPVTLTYPVPTMYDISGSAAFFNKADFGIVIERDRQAGVSRVHVQKVKFRHLGRLGVASFVFQDMNGRFAPVQEAEYEGQVTELPKYDHSNWLTRHLEEQQRQQVLFNEGPAPEGENDESAAKGLV